jgi:hypothetical protein
MTHKKTKLKMTVPAGMTKDQAQDLLLKKVNAAHKDLKKLKECQLLLVDLLTSKQ